MSPIWPQRALRVPIPIGRCSGAGQCGQASLTQIWGIRRLPAFFRSSYLVFTGAGIVVVVAFAVLAVAAVEGKHENPLNPAWPISTPNFWPKNGKCLRSRCAGGGGRTHMLSEERGILSPVRLPVPPLQQVSDSFEFTPDLRKPHCNGSCNGSRRDHLTLRSGAARSCLRCFAYSSRRSPAPRTSASSMML